MQMEEEKWEGSKAFLTLKAKKEKGIRAAAFIESDFYKLDMKPYLDGIKENSSARMIQVVNDHAEMAFWFGWERCTDAMTAALVETAKAASIDLSEPPEPAEPGMEQ